MSCLFLLQENEFAKCNYLASKRSVMPNMISYTFLVWCCIMLHRVNCTPQKINIMLITELASPYFNYKKYPLSLFVQAIQSLYGPKRRPAAPTQKPTRRPPRPRPTQPGVPATKKPGSKPDTCSTKFDAVMTGRWSVSVSVSVRVRCRIQSWSKRNEREENVSQT